MLEDIIAYHIGKRVSLLDIIHHGDPDNAMLMFWMGKRFPEFYPEKIEEYYAEMKRGLEYHNKLKRSEKPTESSNIEQEYGFCSICQERVDKWIDVYPFSILCIDCAQYTMKSMLEDIIEYYNETPVSLFEIICYGNTKIDEMKAEEKHIEEYLAARQLEKRAVKDCKTNILFDLDNEEDEFKE